MSSSSARNVGAFTAAVLAAMTAACSFDSGGVSFDDAGGGAVDGAPGVPDARSGPDAPPGLPDARVTADAMTDAGCAGNVLTVGYSNILECDIPAPLGPLNLNDDGIWYLSTNTGALTDGNTTINVASALVQQTSGTSMVRVVSVSSLTIQSSAFDQLTTLAAYGTYPLIIVSFGDITIDGFLYAGADTDTPGPGGNLVGCSSGTGDTGALQDSNGNGIGGAGGGGGSYGPGAANGGRVGGANGSNSPTPSGNTNGNNGIVPLRGGCAGGAGGNNGGPGGAGGGAVQLVAEGTLTISGFVSVRGGGGLPPQPDANQPSAAGGGGGGSGGALLLEGSTVLITSTAVLVSHGGGGGQGTRSGGASFGGAAGENGHSADTVGAAGGVSGVSAGGPGGSGAAGPSGTVGLEGSSAEGTAGGGGGGGGGRGRIRINGGTETIQVGAIVSPAAA